MKCFKKIKITIFTAGILASSILFIPGQENIVFAQTPETPLSGKCFPDSPNVRVGETVAWVADVSGGNANGRYRYSWAGTDKLMGSSWSTRKTYETPGVKTASVRIRTRTQSIVRTCSVNVGGEVLGDSIGVPPSPPSPLSLSCFATPTIAEVGESVSWTVTVSGGDGKFSYDWAGTEGLSGNTNSITKTYTNTGTKSASVNVVSGNRSATTNCSLEIFPAGTFRSSGESPTGNNATLDELPQTRIVGNIWKALFFIITAIGLTILLALVIILRNKSSELKTRTAMAYETKSRETDVAHIIETEARHKKVLVSADALKILIENSEHDPAESIKNLHRLIGEMRKHPLTTIPGEERWPVIDKEEVEKYFLRRKAE